MNNQTMGGVDLSQVMEQRKMAMIQGTEAFAQMAIALSGQIASAAPGYTARETVDKAWGILEEVMRSFPARVQRLFEVREEAVSKQVEKSIKPTLKLGE